MIALLTICLLNKMGRATACGKAVAHFVGLFFFFRFGFANRNVSEASLFLKTASEIVMPAVN